MLKRRVFALIADTHVGSPYGPWPEDFQIEPGFYIQPSDGQTVINNYLIKDALSIFDREQVDTVIFVGDLNDGGNRKEYARDRMTADLNYQSLAAIKLLTPCALAGMFMASMAPDIMILST